MGQRKSRYMYGGGIIRYMYGDWIKSYMKDGIVSYMNGDGVEKRDETPTDVFVARFRRFRSKSQCRSNTPRFDCKIAPGNSRR